MTPKKSTFLACRYLILFMIILFRVSFSDAQVQEEWVVRYNGPGNVNDIANDIAIDSAGNIYVTGGSDGGSATGTDYATIKYNSLGVQQWAARYNGPGNGIDVPYSLAVDNNGNVYVTGESTGDGTSFLDYATIKYNSSGTQQWVARYHYPLSNNSSDRARSLAVDNNGNVYVTGSSNYSDTSSSSDCATIKYNSSGVQQWVTRYHVPEAPGAVGWSLAVDSSGNAYVTGQSSGGATTGLDWTTIKYNSSGTQQWVAQYNGPGNGFDYALSLVLDNAGYVYVTGYSPGGSATRDDYATIKYNSAGVQQWVARYNGPGNLTDQARSLAVDKFGNVYVTGESYEGTATRYDYATIKYNPSGVQQWVTRYTSPGNQDDRARSLAIDTAGNVYVTGFSPGTGTNNIDYATIKYNTTGVQQWVQRYNGPASGTHQGSSIAVDSTGNVYVTGYSQGNGTGYDFATIKYSQGLHIIRPQAGERWIAGDLDTIRWTGGQAGQFLSIELSVDSGITYTSVDFAIPADSGKYLWTVPDSLSTRAKIKLSDVSTSDSLAVSDTFRVKGYVLTRLNSIGHYERFLPTKDGWSFLNSSSQFWPSSWWVQFHYSDSTDPNTGNLYSSIFTSSPIFALSSDFMDWPLFTSTFGRDQCFWFFTNYYRTDAVNFWGGVSEPHNGSCFGIAVSSLLAFHYKDQFLARHPGIPDFDSLFVVQPMTNTLRLVINGYFTKQLGKLKANHDLANQSTTPRQTLQWVKQMFSNDDPDDDATLRLYDPAGSGGHAVVPYRLIRNGSNPVQFRLFVCNSNNPASLSDFILIDSLANTWQEVMGLGWGVGSLIMYPHPPAHQFFLTPILPSLPRETGVMEAASDEIRGNRFQVSTSPTMNVSIRSQTGDSIGFADGFAFDSMENAIPLVPETGHPQPPLGYDIPPGTYTLRASSFLDSTMYVSVSDGSLALTYSRRGAAPNQRDYFSYDGSFKAKNTDATPKTYDVQALVSEDSSEKTCNIRNLTVVQNDSVSTNTAGGNVVHLVNYGSTKNYHLGLRSASRLGEHLFDHDAIMLQAQSTHTISPRWDSLGSVRILIDVGNNGTIDDTLVVGNTLGVDERGATEIPKECSLSQNYPNPFNPITTIRYALPSATLVSLTVFDILGREVRTLVNEVQEAGFKSIQFDATGLTSGVYFYRLTCRSFSATRKLLLVK